MDLERYWGQVNNWTPENEEQRQDQQRYIRIMMEARELYRKEIMSDEEYERNINLVVDEEQRQQFMNDHISQSSYDEQMDKIGEVINEIDTKYGIGQDRTGNEFTTEVLRKREELLALQAYYRSINDGLARNVMFSDNIETMSSNEIIDYYERVNAALERNADGRSFSELVELGREAVKEEHRQRIRDRMTVRDARNRGADSGEGSENDVTDGSNGNSSNDENDKNTDAEKIQEKIEKFRTDAEKMKAEIDRVKVELVLGEENKGFELTDIVRGLETELGELANDAENLKSEIDAFVLETGAANFSMTPAQIEKRVNELKKGVKNLKQNLVSKYDARVEMTNAKITQLKSMTDLEPEVEALINGLIELQKCDVTVQSWKHNKFLEIIDFNQLVEVNKVIADIEDRLGKKKTSDDGSQTGVDNVGDNSSAGSDNGENTSPTEDNDLEADIAYIESEIERVESEIVPDLSVDDINNRRRV